MPIRCYRNIDDYRLATHLAVLNVLVTGLLLINQYHNRLAAVGTLDFLLRQHGHACIAIDWVSPRGKTGGRSLGGFDMTAIPTPCGVLHRKKGEVYQEEHQEMEFRLGLRTMQAGGQKVQ